jgi:DNA-binding MarR family transcriptional regulator
MLKNGWVAESARRPAADQDDERRRYYRLTPLGRRIASTEAERLWRLVTIARAHRLLSRA